MPYGQAPYQETGLKAALRRASIGLVGAFSAPVQQGGGFWDALGAGIGGSSRAYSAAQQAAQEYAMKQQAMQEERDFREYQKQHLAAQTKALGNPKPLQPYELPKDQQDAIIEFEARKAAALAKAKGPETNTTFDTYVKEARFRKANPDLFPTSESIDDATLDSYVTTTRSGKAFLDMSQLTGKDHAAAIRYAARKGVPAIGAADVSQLQDIDAAASNVEDVLDQLHGFLPADAQGRITAYPGIRLSALLQTNADRAAFSTWRGSAIRTLRATAGSKGLRLNQKEIDIAVKNEIPQITDTYDVATRKVNNVKKMLHNAENPILSRRWGRTVGSAEAAKADPLGVR